VIAIIWPSVRLRVLVMLTQQASTSHRLPISLLFRELMISLIFRVLMMRASVEHMLVATMA
jgi:hypothetical protein